MFHSSGSFAHLTSGTVAAHTATNAVIASMPGFFADSSPIHENGMRHRLRRGVNAPGQRRSPKITIGGTSTKVMSPTSSMPAPPSRPNWLNPRNDGQQEAAVGDAGGATAAAMPRTDVGHRRRQRLVHRLARLPLLAVAPEQDDRRVDPVAEDDRDEERGVDVQVLDRDRRDEQREQQAQHRRRADDPQEPDAAEVAEDGEQHAATCR